MAAPVKILVSGDVRGKFKALFARLAQVNAKAGPFAAMFCVGTFFDPEGENNQLDPFIKGTQSIAVPTYFIGGGEDASKGSTKLIDGLPDGGEVCPNLFYLGRAGVKEVMGLQVAFLSGMFDPYKYPDDPKKSTWRAIQYEVQYHQADLEVVMESINKLPNGADLLLTAEWGEGYDLLLTEPPALTINALSKAVGKLAAAVDCRYHFAGTENVSFKLLPFKNEKHVTRFYGVGTVANKQKVKSIEAISVVPVASMDPAAFPALRASATVCPYTYFYEPPVEAASEATEGEEGKTGISMHEELEDGRWKCGLCGNVNYAHQKKKCHMRNCAAPRYPDAPPSPEAPKKVIGVTSREEALAQLKAQEAAIEAKKHKRVSLYIAQKPMKKKSKR